jgi:3-oxoacyl-[acyl-carrier-protein] synthase III
VCCNISRYDGPNFRFSFEPSIVLRLKQRFGFDQALAFDIPNACAGMFTAIDIADAFIGAGLIRRGSVVSGEYISHLTRTAQKEIRGFMDPRLACLTLGDAGAAIILERASNDESGFHEIDMYTLGKYSSLCIAKATDQPHGGAIMLTDSIKSSAIAIKQAVLSSARVLLRSGRQAEAFQHHHARRPKRHSGRRARDQPLLRQEDLSREHDLRRRRTRQYREHQPFRGLDGQYLNDRIGRATTSSSHQRLRADGGHGVVHLDDARSLRRAKRQDGGRRNDQRSARRSAPPAYATSADRQHRTIADACPSSGTRWRWRRWPPKTVCVTRHTPERPCLIMFAGVYRNDFLCEPAVAALLAGELGINSDTRSPDDKRTFVFDVFNGALGFLNACHVAVQMIRVGKHKNVMVVASEIENNTVVQPDRLLGIKETARRSSDSTDSGRLWQLRVQVTPAI